MSLGAYLLSLRRMTKVRNAMFLSVRTRKNSDNIITRMLSEIARYATPKGRDDIRFIMPLFVYQSAEILSNLYKYDYEYFYTQIDRADINENTIEVLNLEVLKLIKAYDICNDEHFLQIAEYLAKKLENFQHQEEYTMNRLQIKKRLGIWGEEESSDIGLCEHADQHRPDKDAKAELKSKAPTVFPVPCRQAVYETIEEKQKEANKLALGKSLAKQSIAIIPKIREVDEFLGSHPEYKNVILESHPELAFSRLSGQVLLSRKKEFLGFSERCYILSEYLGDGNDLLKKLSSKAKELGCSPDDVVDATCMAVTAAMKAHDMCETVPAEPEKDSTGLLMQMIVPKMMR